MRLTKAQQAAKAVVLAWCAQDAPGKAVQSVRHVHPRVYVVGYAAPGCLIVANPWMDSEPQVQEFDRACPLSVVRRFDRSLRPGDWCYGAYVNTTGCGERVAVPMLLESSTGRYGQRGHSGTRKPRR